MLVRAQHAYHTLKKTQHPRPCGSFIFQIQSMMHPSASSVVVGNLPTMLMLLKAVRYTRSLYYG